MEWLTAILGTVLQVGVDWFRSWYAAEKAEADRWAARTKEGQMASLKRAAVDSAAAKAAAAKATAPATPAEWNLGAAPVLLLGLLLLPGCITRTVYIPAARPILEAPARPAVPTEPVAWTDRERILAGYATALEALVQEYNRRAKEENAANGY